MEDSIPVAVVVIDTVHRVILDSVTLDALKNSQEFYDSAFKDLQGSFMCFATLISILIALLVAITVAIVYINFSVVIAKYKEELKQEKEQEKESFKSIMATEFSTEIEKIKTNSYFIDTRDMQTYRTVKIGSQVWMAENLNYCGENDSIGTYYNDSHVNGKKYGRLYTWEQVKKACPNGWHLPTNEEWQNLISFVGGNNIAGEKLKSKFDWKNSGTDEFFFSALPGGLYFSPKSKFICIGEKGVWWSTTEINDTKIFSRGIDCNGNYVFEGDEPKNNLLSIRCIKD